MKESHNDYFHETSPVLLVLLALIEAAMGERKQSAKMLTMEEEHVGVAPLLTEIDTTTGFLFFESGGGWPHNMRWEFVPFIP